MILKNIIFFGLKRNNSFFVNELDRQKKHLNIMIKKHILILAVTTLGCVSTAFHKAQSVASCKVKVKEAFLLSVQKNMMYFIPEKVDGVCF
jgi:hypothetical protein